MRHSSRAWSLALVAGLVVTSAAPSAARGSDTPSGTGPLRLLGLVLTTGQAVVWDGEREEYVLLRPGSRYQGYTVRRLLIDRIIVTRERQLSELRLRPAPLIHRGSRRPERRGTPAGILVTRPGDVTPAPQPAPPPTSTPPPAVTREPPATPPTPVPEEAARAPGPSSANAPAETPDKGISMDRLRKEVSRMIRGQAPYRISLPRSGGVLLHRVNGDTLLGRVGLRDGDLVLSVDGVTLRTRDDAINHYLSLKPGRRLEVVLLRNGERRTLRLDLV